jgi:AcrR family transcriptional regulator
LYAPKDQKIVPRKTRTDAQRKRERILEVAKEAFTRSDANASLDDIAKEVGKPYLAELWKVSPSSARNRRRVGRPFRVRPAS